MAVEIKIFTTAYCPYCTMAKRFLQSLDVSYEDIDVSYDPETRRKLVEMSGMRTVPQIFIDGESIGGYTDMMALHRSGILETMLYR